MSSVKLSVLSAVAAIVLVSAWCSWLRHERNAEAHALRLANARLQREAPVHNQTDVAPSPVAPGASKFKESVAATPAPKRKAAATADYRFQGQATPVDALQTMAWAMDQGDVELMMRMITFDETARSRLEAHRASLPPETRAQWPTVDALAATLLTSRGINHPYPRADLLARATVEPISADRVLVRLPGTPKDREIYQKVGDVWKWVITEPLVNAYLEYAARDPGR